MAALVYPDAVPDGAAFDWTAMATGLAAQAPGRWPGRHRWPGLFCGVYWHAARNTMDMFKFGDGAEMVKLPLWPFASILLLCGLLMILAFSLQLLRAILDMPIVRQSIDHE